MIAQGVINLIVEKSKNNLITLHTAITKFYSLYLFLQHPSPSTCTVTNDYTNDDHNNVQPEENYQVCITKD